MRRQEEIVDFLTKNDITEAWLARKLSFSPQKLHGKLHKNKELDLETYQKIREILGIKSDEQSPQNYRIDYKMITVNEALIFYQAEKIIEQQNEIKRLKEELLKQKNK